MVARTDERFSAAHPTAPPVSPEVATRTFSGSLSGKPVEAAHEEAGAEILEGAGGPVEELDCVQARLLRVRHDDRNREVEGFGADCGKVGSERIAFEERFQQLRSELCQRCVRIEARRCCRDNLRHVQVRHPAQHRYEELGKGWRRAPARAC